VAGRGGDMSSGEVLGFFGIVIFLIIAHNMGWTEFRGGGDNPPTATRLVTATHAVVPTTPTKAIGILRTLRDRSSQKKTDEADRAPEYESWMATEDANERLWAKAEQEYEETLESKLATDEAEEPGSGYVYEPNCYGGCVTYPDFCAPPILGNVSYNSGERIYHMPGDEYYDDTEIDPDYDEYYFCTPDEAEAAGFRHAYR
jgi:hypothetical protein